MTLETTSYWRAKLRPLLRKALILHLAAITACSSNVEQYNQSIAVQQASGINKNRLSGDGTTSPTPPPEQASQRQQLPDLGSDVAHSKAQEQASDQQEKSTLDGLMAGEIPESQKQTIANPFQNRAMDSDSLEGMAAGLLTSAASQTVKDWFSAKHATAELAIGAGKGGTSSGSFDLLVPVYDTERELFFTQIGLRRSNTHTEDYRNTVNLGVGYRRNVDNWLAGVNAFYDRDMTGKNERFSLGAEAFTNNVRASANVYVRLSDWKKSPDLDYYLERPANGYDLRVEANLPSIPQVVGKLVYEQYFGDEVGLFGASDRQKDPQAVTVGLAYNPVPLIGLGVDYRQGQGGLSETSGKISFNYQFGVSLAKQLSPNYHVNRDLTNSRYGLVNRNNEIVLEYKRSEHANIAIPLTISGTPAAVVAFPVTLTGGHVGNVAWTGTASAFALPYNGSGNGSLVMPAYSTGVNTYTLQAVATNVYGEVVRSNVMDVTVTPFLIALERSKGEAKADGSDEVTFTASLREPDGSPKVNTTITWSVNGSATVVEKDEMTNSVGKANLKLVSRFSTNIRVSAKEPQGAAASSEADFTGDPTSAKVLSLTATPASITANGTSTSTLVATLNDKNGNPVGSNVRVDWSTTKGTLASASTVTDDESKATVVLTSPIQIGSGVVTAKAVAGSATTNVAFTADIANARILTLVATPAAIPADGTSSSSVTATIGDFNGNPVGAGVPVSFTATDGTLSTASTVTDSASHAVVTLKSSIRMGVSTVTAKAAAGESSAPVTFAANSATAKVTTLVANPTLIPANDSTTSTLEATVEDANGNPVANAPVTWTTSLGTLSAASNVTDNNGKASVTLKGSLAGTATVRAAATAGSVTATVQLVSDNTTAKVVSLIATPASIPANNTATSLLEAVVKDGQGNVVPGIVVTWSTTLGAVSSSSTTTDQNGKTSVTLKGTVAGAATIKAASSAGSSTTTVTLVADLATAKVIDVIATPASIVANNAATSSLQAIVEDANGNPVANASVSWSTSLGTLSAASNMTDTAGKAIVTLKGTTAGSASVTATASAGASSANVTLTPDGTTAKVVDLTATPASIIANGTSTSTLVATIKDANGNLAGPGVAVNWTATSGHLASTSTVTDASSKASVVLTSSTVAGTATVTAQGAAGSANTVVTFTPDINAARVISLSATPSTITANGSDQSQIVATVEDAHGNTMSAGVPITWTTTDGSLSLGSSLTDAAGKARVTLTAGMSMAVATVKGAAVAGGATTTVQFVADVTSARVVALSRNPDTIVANGSDASTFVATLEDSGGNPMPAGVPVNWTTSKGTLASSSTVTDGRGKATVTLTGTVAGSGTVTASAAQGSANAGITLIADVTTAKVISVTAIPASIVANGSATSTLTASVVDAHGNAIPAGVAVAWQSNLGTVSSGSTATDGAGKTNITLKGTTAGTATVQASAVAGASSTTVVLTPESSTARVVGLVASPSTITANNVATSSLTATVKDANGNTVGSGIQVSFTSSGGTLSNASATTNASGQAIVTLRGTTAGSVTVTASAVAGSSNAQVTLVADTSTARVAGLTASPTSIVANGSNASTLTATVRDAFGNNVGSGVNVSFTTNSGTLSAPSAVTNASGQAAVSLRGTVATTATVTASAVAGSAQANVVLVGDVSTARVVSVTASPTSVPADGTPSTLVATVLDANNNNVGPGVTVSWSANGGSLSTTSTTTNVNGQVAVTWSNTVPGAFTATATAATGSASAVVTFTSVAPVINSFTERSGGTANQLSYEANGFGTPTPGSTIYDSNIFSWSAFNATSYELHDSAGHLVWSGTATSIDINHLNLQVIPDPVVTWTLIARNGTASSTASITLTARETSCQSGCSSGG